MANDIQVRGHQFTKSVVIPVAYDDFTSGTANVLCELPPGSIVTGGQYIAVTAWDSATSAVLDIGDATLAGVAIDDDRYTSTQLNLKTATASTAFDVTGYKATAPINLIATVTVVGATTAGAGLVVVSYVREGKADQTSG